MTGRLGYGYGIWLFFIRSLCLLYLRAAQHDPAILLQGTGYTLAEVEALEYIPAEALAMLLQNIDAAGFEPGWAARVGEQFHISAHGPLGFAALSAPTLGDALDVMIRYHAVRVTSITAEMIERDNQLLFVIHDLTGEAQYAQWLAETVLKVIESLIETIMGHPVGEQVTISFTAPAPAYEASLAKTYGSPCVFNAPHNAIAVPRSWAGVSSPLYDEAMYRNNLAQCRDIIRAQGNSADPVQKVRDLLHDHFELCQSGAGNQAAPTLEAVAAQLHITPRTLIRRMRAADTSFRELLEQARRVRAEQMLGLANFTVAEVAGRLGYSDPANFGRAFKQRTGNSPAAWRRNQ